MTATPAPGQTRDARDFAIAALIDVVFRRLPLDERLEKLGREPEFQALSPSDRGLARAIASSAVRGLGLIRSQLAGRLAQGIPVSSGPLEAVLIAAVAQILFLDVPDYAAVDTAIDKLRADRRADRYVRLANAVLRSIARDRAAILDQLDPLTDNTPGWLAARWSAAYGVDTARAIAAAHLQTPPLDLSVKSDPEGWAARLGATLMPGGTLRLTGARNVPDLPGFAEGAWWVQDLAAALPARLFGALHGRRVLDLCAAPGGKTAELIARGAKVVAVDRSAPRLDRLKANLTRLGMAAETHVGDALTFHGGPFEAILLDAPCSATGTIRRHPDVAWNKTLADIASLASLQSRLIDKAWSLLAPGGTLIYSTCSLEPEEGERQIDAFLSRTAGARIAPIEACELNIDPALVTPQGTIRCLPCQYAAEGGLDGFFVARLVRA